MKSSKVQEFKSLSLAALLMAVVTFIACSSDDDSVEQKGIVAGKTYFMTVDATKAGFEDADNHASTRVLTESSEGLNAEWATTEHVYVSYDNKWFTGSLTPNANAATAKLNGAISIEISIPENPKLNLQYPRQEWSYTGQVGTLADISAKYNYATAATNITIDGDNVDAASSVTFTNQQAIVKFILKNGADPVNPTSLRISASGLKSGKSTMDDIVITPSETTNEIYCALRGITGNLILTATTAEGIYTYRKTAVSFSHGQYYVITVPMKVKAYPITLPEVTPHYVGSVVGSDGNVYAKASDVPTGNTAVAMIAYVSGTGHGIAFALADEGKITLGTAQTTATGKAFVSGGSWRVPTQSDWNNIIANCHSYNALNSKLSAAGGSPLDDQRDYWAKHDSSDGGYSVSKSDNGISFKDAIDPYDINYFRAILAF
ncbi:MAG: hypothetical protein J5790_09045 [Bacteroidaceae bacterium]|nr:hypothetical protein [Bacteroidaceae bacterium]